MRLRWRWCARGWRRLRRSARIEQQRQQQQGFGQDRFQHHNAKYDTPDLCFPVSSTAKIAAGHLYVVATPIGNLGDLAPRAQAILQGDRKSVGSGKSVSVRVDLGGRRILKKKTKQI